MSDFVSGTVAVTVGAIAAGVVAATSALARFLAETGRLATAGAVGSLATDSATLGHLAATSTSYGSFAEMHAGAPLLAALTQSYFADATTTSAAALPSLAQQAVKQLQADERNVTSTVLSDSLASLGYQVEPTTTVGQNARVAARNGETVVVVEVRPGGAFDIDTAGFRGDACVHAVNKLLDEAKRRGVTFGSVTHRPQRHIGGRLINPRKSTPTPTPKPTLPTRSKGRA